MPSRKDSSRRGFAEAAQTPFKLDDVSGFTADPDLLAALGRGQEAD